MDKRSKKIRLNKEQKVYLLNALKSGYVDTDEIQDVLNITNEVIVNFKE